MAISKIDKLIEEYENLKKNKHDLWLIKEIFTTKKIFSEGAGRVTGKLFVKQETIKSIKLRFWKSAGYESEPFEEEIEMLQDMKEDFYELLTKYEDRLNNKISELENKIKD